MYLGFNLVLQALLYPIKSKVQNLLDLMVGIFLVFFKLFLVKVNILLS
jgi:hypothetical protein